MSEALSAEMRRCGAFEWAAKLEALEEKVQYAANAATDLARQLRVAEARIEALDKKVAAAQKYVETLLEFGDDETGHYHVGDEVALEDLRDALAEEKP